MNDSPHAVRVFVNAQGVDVPAGATALDAVRALSAAEAAAVLNGERVITDSRGLPTDPETRVSAGSIFRLLPVRKRSSAAPADGIDDA